MKVSALASFTSLPRAHVEAPSCRRSNLPEQMRMNATRSRCCGSMFAWILNTKPVSLLFVGADFARGGRARLRRRRVLDEEVEQQLHAEVVDRRAEEHRRLLAGQVGLAGRTGCEAPCTSSSSSRSSAQHRPRRCAPPAAGSSSDAKIVESWRVKLRPGSYRCTSPVTRCTTPFRRWPMPIGQVTGAHWMPSTDSTSSSRSIGELAFAVELVDEGHDRRVAQAAHLHQLDRAFLDALGARR